MLLPTTAIKTRDELVLGTNEILALIRNNVNDPRKVRDLTFVLGTLDAIAGIGLDALTGDTEGVAKQAVADAWVKKVSTAKAAAFGFKV